MSGRLAEAIRTRRVVEFSYRGRDHSVEPRAFGYDDAGELTLAGWQLTGERGQGFRTFEVRLIRRLTVSGRSFEADRPEYDPARPALRHMICEL